MPQPEHVLNFHCGVCTRQLTDATALFTSCGHFFCYNQQGNCTRLRLQQSGRCEQCGKECDVGNLANKGNRYDSRVQSFVFSDLTKDLQTIAEIVEFRNKHLHILGENAAAQQKKISSLTAQCKSHMAENQHLRRENEQLRLELSRQKNIKASTINLESPTMTQEYEPNASEGVTVVELDPPERSSVLQMGKRRSSAYQGTPINRGTEPGTRARTLADQMYDRSLRSKSINKRRESQPLASRLRRSYGGAGKQHGSVPLKRSRAQGSGANVRYGASKAGVNGGLSRFGYLAGESRRTVREPFTTRKRFTGDWQRKVSSVPRPSATPDKLRRRARKSVVDANVLGKRY